MTDPTPGRTPRITPARRAPKRQPQDDGSYSESSDAPRTLSEKLDRLFKTVHPPGRRQYSYQEVATTLAERGGQTISATYVWQLRKGVKDNPTKKHLEALSDFFGVPPAYFFDDATAERIDAELRLLTAMRDAAVRGVALRAAGLSHEALRVIRDLIEYARRREGVPDAPEDDGHAHDNDRDVAGGDDRASGDGHGHGACGPWP